MSYLKTGRYIVNVARSKSYKLDILGEKSKSLVRHISGSQRLSSPPKLNATPHTGLADELLDIRATGLEAGKPVVLRSEVYTECGRFGFESQAQYTADQNGEVSVSTHPSEGGTYKGIEPMGLLWSVKSMPAFASKNPRVFKFKPATPFVYKLTMYRGSGGDDQGIENQEELDSISVERHYVAPYVEHDRIECGGAQGILYLPKKAGQSSLPLVIDMPGLGPTFARDRPALLASHGFGVFEFNYFESLKNDSQRQDNSFFNCQLIMDIVNFAKEHPYLDENRIGINGACYGGALALNAVSRIPDLPIRCVGVQRCVDFLATNVGLDTTTGIRIEPAGPPESYTMITERDDGKEWFQFDFDHKVHDMDCREEYVAPVENISMPLMLLICGDDQQCASEKCMTRAASRIRAAGKSDLLEVHRLEGAGHLLDSPYFPLCRQSKIYMPFHDKPMMVNWGGDPVLHAKAQVTAWQKTISFYRRHLGPVVDCRQDWHDDK